MYLIYYSGENKPFAPYDRIADLNRNNAFTHPIYAGKAVPAGGRRGTIDTDGSLGFALWSRLTEHSDTIRSVSNLSISDFWARFLVVDDTWIGHGEGLLLRHFRPIWNQVLDGFGNHDPGSGRYNQRRSPWDTVHPGRAWAFRCADHPKSSEQMLVEIETYVPNISI
ncbi:Eco29kI family restriction endonuclease [Skermanella stibiiresistens]|uniref:Eco29kI family restriction endonuclease n=1 Tax=Skermanella stibiiresistens TaxID=913326 RepID=UPI001FDF81EC|nr:Eco29kI family restriction endonuclease [Skermanella stibiiresistens]